MATLKFPAQRLMLAGGFAVAIAAAPVLAAFAAPVPNVAPVAQSCSGGEEPDQFTGVCVPHTVPNAGSTFSTPAGNPDVPEVLGVPCIGHNQGGCIGLDEEAQAEQVTPPPAPVFSHSP
ncbi:hypothetical protein [Mycobacterium sp. IS-3022]|uniref:hypothetical protein n=1 Tax=Mycobacterium sp. IS-3022 TaxID=1772277 RepID=UPI00074169EA|nr:hypothetical protein [Mycobacterium sp. IS-3022]KUI06166.1 hypothetical protein AU188_02080 [Mycobacterium sp. IS-3022]